MPAQQVRDQVWDSDLGEVQGLMAPSTHLNARRSASLLVLLQLIGSGFEASDR